MRTLIGRCLTVRKPLLKLFRCVSYMLQGYWLVFFLCISNYGGSHRLRRSQKLLIFEFGWAERLGLRVEANHATLLKLNWHFWGNQMRLLLGLGELRSIAAHGNVSIVSAWHLVLLRETLA